jgi:sodium pump decarboxylase gamma subunit
MYEGIEGAIILSIIAMVIVFLVLGLLALLMVGLRKVVPLFSKKTYNEQNIDKKENKLKPTLERKEIIINKAIAEKEDEELIAIISAALASYTRLTPSSSPVKIINIKRLVPETFSSWVNSSRQTMMAERISITTRKRGGF